ncbi:Uncharacterized protein APZ42_008404, partial [Daphnia magna]
PISTLTAEELQLRFQSICQFSMFVLCVTHYFTHLICLTNHSNVRVLSYSERYFFQTYESLTSLSWIPKNNWA